MIGKTLSRLLKGRARPDPEHLKLMARSQDVPQRLRAARDPSAPAEILYYLARDPEPAIRAAVAENTATPRQADLLLALDDVPDIRRRIARKISSSLGTATQESSKVWEISLQVLEALACDDIPEVRRLIAEAGRNIEKIPATLMTDLGRDRVAEVAVPALGYVGRIADSDLVGIVEHAPDQQVIGAVARRPAIGPSVADAVVQHGDQPSIAILLGNVSAEIPPDTIDLVIDRAPPMDSWHDPLVHRPHLTDGAAIRLASFVADRLVQALKSRPDIDPETNASISIIVEKRGEVVEQIIPEIVDTEGPLPRARRHLAAGTLNEDMVIEALGSDMPFVIAALALRGRLPAGVVQKILGSHSAKALLALSWKAGYGMRLAAQLQIRVARLPPKARIAAGIGGNFPLSDKEMRWQIEFFGTLVPNT